MGAGIKDQNFAGRSAALALALFVVLFFPLGALWHSFAGDLVSPNQLVVSLLWRFPAGIVILLLHNGPLPVRPKKDAAVVAVTVPALVLTGFAFSLGAAFTGFSPPPEIPAPQGFGQWAAVISLSLSTGFMEEAYFRVYLPAVLLMLLQNKAGADKHTAGAARQQYTAHGIAALVFALCHVYLGAWGFANALIAAAVFSFVYLKSASFAGIALAHGLYNVFVFAAREFVGGIFP